MPEKGFSNEKLDQFGEALNRWANVQHQRITINGIIQLTYFPDSEKWDEAVWQGLEGIVQEELLQENRKRLLAAIDKTPATQKEKKFTETLQKLKKTIQQAEPLHPENEANGLRLANEFLQTLIGLKQILQEIERIDKRDQIPLGEVLQTIKELKPIILEEKLIPQYFGGQEKISLEQLKPIVKKLKPIVLEEEWEKELTGNSPAQLVAILQELKQLLLQEAPAQIPPEQLKQILGELGKIEFEPLNFSPD